MLQKFGGEENSKELDLIKKAGVITLYAEMQFVALFC